MNRIKFREADELVSALQNDVEEIVFELRGEDRNEEKIKVPAWFNRSPCEYLKFKKFPHIDHAELKDGRIVFYDRGNNYVCNVVDDYIRNRELELKTMAMINEANEVFRNTVINSKRWHGIMEEMG